MVSKDDWRRQGQEEYLMGAKLCHVRAYHPPSPDWDHEHCAFCWEKIGEYEGCEHSGYCTVDTGHWLCEECFRDFADEFQFTVREQEEP